MKRVLSLALLLAMALTMGGCAQSPSPAVTAPPATAEAPTPVPTAAPTPTPSPSPTPLPARLGETKDMGQDYIDRFVFLGDSTTYGLAYYDVLPHTQIWTPASGTLTINNWAVETIEYHDEQGEVSSLSIADAAARRQPEYLLITLGLNGIAFLDEDEFKGYYEGLIHAVQEVSPDTKIICHSIYPVIDAQVPSTIGNDPINTANGWIEAVAEETGTRYLNTHDVLMDENGDLREEYCNGDGIHLSPEGFNVVLKNVRTHGYP